MPLTIDCSCGRRLTAKEEYAGKRVACPVCKKILTLPEADLPILEEHLDNLEVVQPELPARRKAYLPRAGSADEASLPIVEEEPESDDQRPRRRRRRFKDDVSRKASSGSDWFGHNSGSILSGVLMMVIAVVWFVVGLAFDYIFFYPPVLFVVGLVALVRGLTSGE